MSLIINCHASREVQSSIQKRSLLLLEKNNDVLKKRFQLDNCRKSRSIEGGELRVERERERDVLD